MRAVQDPGPMRREQMDTRVVLQITLAVLGVLIVLVGGLIVYELMHEGVTQVVEQVVEVQGDTKVEENPWASEANRQAAIKLVARQTVELPEDKGAKKGEEPEATTSVDALLKDEAFIKDKLKLGRAEPLGWAAQWWGETKYGPQFYLVRYAFRDAHIGIGPAWLVDLKSQKVVPKNVLAEVVLNPQAGVKSDYYDKSAQVVSAITNHRFGSGVNLGGALLLYFAENIQKSDKDTILGWTISHDRANQFNAFFQWMENGAATYAEFQFDYDKKALRPVNLQAADIMRAGEQVVHSRPVDIMPQSYNAAQKTWVGPAKKSCAQAQNQAQCRALATVLNEEALVESLEWLLTGQANKPEDLERCKETHNCRFVPQRKDADNYRILYVFNVAREKSFDPRNEEPEWECPHTLRVDEEAKKKKGWASKGSCVAWDVNAKTSTITPVDTTSTLAYRAIHPRT